MYRWLLSLNWGAEIATAPIVEISARKIEAESSLNPDLGIDRSSGVFPTCHNGGDEGEERVLLVADADLLVVNLHHAVQAGEDAEEPSRRSRHHRQHSADLHVHWKWKAFVCCP